MKATQLGLAVLSLVLASTGTQAHQENQTITRLSALQGQAGDPITSLRLNDSNASWEALGNQDLLVHSPASNQTWLLHTSLCPGLSNQKRALITYAQDMTVHIGTDNLVRMDERGGRCRILEARPIANALVQGVRGNLFVGPRGRNENPSPTYKAST
ncbi:DUF6491 family protein [Dyella subtropica]|uniref:DUF6491 family protein n=1 Tax=Dyella subtropica TaxID=2992127 RepID=UPI002251E05F|nr:DUF6491 family protein [Dyella subtropica]